MVQTKIQNNGFPVKAAIVIVLLLTILPLLLFILVQFAPPVGSAPSAGPSASAEPASGRSAAAERRAQRAENRAARQEAKTTHTATVPHGMAPDPLDMAPDPGPAEFGPPEDISVVGVGAVVPNAPRGKRATPYPPGEVPGDSGIVPHYAGSPDDPVGAPPPPPPAPEDDLWGGRPAAPIPPANMQGIGGVRRIDPNDPFFQQDIPNPFNR